MRYDRETRLWWLSLACLPVLVGVAVAANTWRNLAEYQHRIETDLVGDSEHLDYAGAIWQLDRVRIIGDGSDTSVRFPGQMRLVIVRLVATATSDIGESWGQCEVSLIDVRGRRWLPLDINLSNEISRDLDPKAPPLNGCGVTSLTPPEIDHAAAIEEKFVVPADAISQLSIRLSVAALRPKAISFPLKAR